MRFTTTAPDRRTLVKAIAEHTGMEPNYAGPPTFNYTVGTITVDREGYVDVPDEQAADGAAREGRRVERTCKDGLDHRREALNVQNNDAHSQHDVEQCHEGHQPFTDAADALDAAQQHQPAAAAHLL